MLLLFSCWVMSDSVILWTAACQASLSLTISWSLPKFMFLEPVMLSNQLIFCPLLNLPSIFSSIREIYLYLYIYISLYISLYKRKIIYIVV